MSFLMSAIISNRKSNEPGGPCSHEAWSLMIITHSALTVFTGWYNYSCRGNSVKYCFVSTAESLQSGFESTSKKKETIFRRRQTFLQTGPTFTGRSDLLLLPLLYLPPESILTPHGNRGDKSWLPVFLLTKLIEITFYEEITWLINL